MAANQQDESTSNKSEKTESSLSRRLRSLAKQALPPDPYSQDGLDNSKASQAGFELDTIEEEEEAKAAPEPVDSAEPDTSASPSQAIFGSFQEPWNNKPLSPTTQVSANAPEPLSSQAVSPPAIASNQPILPSSMLEPPAKEMALLDPDPPSLPEPPAMPPSPFSIEQMTSVQESHPLPVVPKPLPLPESSNAPEPEPLIKELDPADFAVESVVKSLSEEANIEPVSTTQNEGEESEKTLEKPRRKRRRPARQYTNVPDTPTETEIEEDKTETLEKNTAKEQPSSETAKESSPVAQKEAALPPDKDESQEPEEISDNTDDDTSTSEPLEKVTALQEEKREEKEEPRLPAIAEPSLAEKAHGQHAPVVQYAASNIPDSYWQETSDRQKEAIELLSSIDEVLGVCAMNMSSLQQASNQQTEAFSQFKDTLQNQTFFELGLNLNTLMESLSAALEPMKAVGELVPSIDQLVQALEDKTEMEQEKRLTPDEMVNALADQLAAGQIDPWTFKCAYMAVYPDEHPADLLRRLVDSLGTQRLPGDLFRAAYEAIQAAEAPPSTIVGSNATMRESLGSGSAIQNEEMMSQLDEMRKSNEELKEMIQSREDELTKRIEERENEYSNLLQSKEKELQDIHSTLNNRLEEFNTQYDEMVDAIKQREEELHNKENELEKKDSEISQLKAQLDELQEQFTDTVGGLQKQLTSTKQAADDAAQRAIQKPEEEKQKSSSSFFESSEPKTPLLDNSSSRNPLQQQMETFKTMSKPVNKPMAPPAAPTHNASTPTMPLTHSASAPPTSPPTTPLPEPSNQAVPSSTPTTPTMQGGGGIYSNGVRTQVFEVIVRQALAGAPWREICAGPMQVNNISADEVEGEVKRRQELLNK